MRTLAGDAGTGEHRQLRRYLPWHDLGALGDVPPTNRAAVIGDRVRSMTALAELMIPWDRGDVLAAVHREGQVLTESAEENGMRLKARLEPASLGALREYVLDVEGGLPFESDDEDAW